MFPVRLFYAWYHRKLSPEYQNRELTDYLNEVRTFAGSEYLQALFRGSALSDDEKKTVAKKIAGFTGLSEGFVLRANLRVEIFRFCKELLRDRCRTIGRLDSRYIGIDKDAAGEIPEDDPSSYEITGLFAGAFNDYINRELEYKSDIPYSISTDLWKIWSYKEHENQYLQLEETLRKTMVRNKFMKVWVLNGYYDLATPFFAAKYVFSHLNLDQSLQKNLSMTYYKAGHMMYLHQASLEKFRADAEGFYRDARTGN